MLTAGTVVAFDFTLPRISLSDPPRRRTGLGVIVDEDVLVGMFHGYGLRVLESHDYHAGEGIRVAWHNVRPDAARTNLADAFASLARVGVRS